MGKEANPIPQGKYVPATRFGQLIYTAGMTPRKNGVLMMEGKLGQAANLEDYREAVVQAAKNALTAARNKLNEGEALAQILSITVYVNAEADFTGQFRLAGGNWRIWHQTISVKSWGRPALEAEPPLEWHPFPETLRWKFPLWRQLNRFERKSPGFKSVAIRKHEKTQ